MCGIAGYITDEVLDRHRVDRHRVDRHHVDRHHVDRHHVDRHPVDRTLALMHNRGPDHQASTSFRHGCHNVALLHSRLSIIDPDPRSHQPMTIDHCTLVFNGEIYNYLELRRDLESRGVAFHTTSDSEVLLRCYLAHGASCAERFEGMWSFAIYDRREGILLLSRDRFGEKPLYVHSLPRGLYFGSEVKFIAALAGRRWTPDLQHLSRYLVNGYRALYKTTETFFEEIEQFPCGSSQIIDQQWRRVRQRYWHPRWQPQPMTLQQAVEGVRQRLLDSVQLRLRADVPLAFCLSGGVDSAALASVAAKCCRHDVSTFSIVDPDPRYDESPNIAATVADLGCPHTTIRLQKTGSLDHLRRLVGYHDAPVYTISYYIHSLLVQAMSRRGYKVTVSGTAADELFTGYYDHFNLHLCEMRHSPQYPQLLAEWREGVGRHVRNPHLQDPELYVQRPHFRDHIYLNSDTFASYLVEDFREPFHEQRFCGSLLRNRMLNELFCEVTPAILHEDDLNSMLYSMENRSPYLDRRLFEFACSIPTEHLIREGFGKYVLREALRGIVNEQVLSDRRKVGFNASIGSVLDFAGGDLRDEILDGGSIYELVHKNRVEALLSQGRWSNSESKFLFGLISAKLFLDGVGGVVDDAAAHASVGVAHAEEP